MAPIHSYSGDRRWTVATHAPFWIKCAGLAFRDYFVATIASIVAKVLPIGAIGIIGITVFALAYAAGDKTASGAITTALSELNSSLIWLIVVAFMIARGFIKTGLGRRIALQMIRLLGKRTLGLAYGLAFADLILSPAMPSNTARCGGVIYPIADSLARQL
ncbi:putative cation transporter [Salmonella enterica subsp. arizonae]|nr:putative cation transporter [Salmonella enterica subsp. arizonae]